MLRLHDTASQEVRELALREPGVVTIYLCGPTVYGPPHLGHGRATVVYDILRRYLEWRGLTVRFVSNVTDIDDHIIERAQREGRDAAEIATRCEAVWWKAMDLAGVERPTLNPHATEYVAQMVATVSELVDRGVAYATDDGIYFSVESVADYGLLAHQSLEQLRDGGGEREIHGAEGKRHPSDFVLWKLAKPGEPAWPSPWGEGRPGWHTECVVMSLGLLGDGFDLHCGGLDLKFPHHENERAQAEALGRAFARHWMHHAFIVDPTGEKMSKSLGNFDNLLDLFDQHDPRAFRLVLLQAHYRSPLQLGRQRLEAAERALHRLDAVVRRTADLPPTEPAHEAVDAFTSRMDDDLDTPGATAVLFDTATAANVAVDEGDLGRAARLAAAVREMAGAVGLELGRTGEVPDGVAARVHELDAARAAGDYAAADAVRAQLQAEGWVVETTREGTTVRR